MFNRRDNDASTNGNTGNSFLYNPVVLPIELEDAGALAIAKPVGPSVDISNVAEFKTALLAVAESAQQLIVDLSQIQLLDSSGLGAMLSVMRAMRARNGGFAIACPTEPVQLLFELVMMDRVFQIFSTVEEAKHALVSN